MNISGEATLWDAVTKREHKLTGQGLRFMKNKDTQSRIPLLLTIRATFFSQ